MKKFLSMTMSFPVPIDIARTRLQSSFVLPLAGPAGYHWEINTYNGRIDGDDLEIQFAASGKNPMKYRLRGHLYAEAHGTRLEMSLEDWYQIVFIIAGVWNLMGSVGLLYFIGVKGLTLFFVSLPVGILWTITVTGIIAMRAYSIRRKAAKAVVTLLQNIISYTNL